MLALVEAVIGAFFAAFRPRASLVAENLALRQQLATLLRQGPRPRLRPVDRAFWIVLSQVWSRWEDVLAFLRTHLVGTLAIDFLTVPTVTFQVLYVFFVLSLERRRLLHVTVTAHPYAAWVLFSALFPRLALAHFRDAPAVVSRNAAPGSA